MSSRVLIMKLMSILDGIGQLHSFFSDPNFWRARAQ